MSRIGPYRKTRLAPNLFFLGCLRLSKSYALAQAAKGVQLRNRWYVARYRHDHWQAFRWDQDHQRIYAETFGGIIAAIQKLEE